VAGEGRVGGAPDDEGSGISMNSCWMQKLHICDA
jgi:hypothetical protein